MNKKNYESFLKMTRIFQNAVKKAQSEHKIKGIPNVYLKNGEKVWEMPDGTFTNKYPPK